MLGHLFDTLGRRRMIAGTFALSAAILVNTGCSSAACPDDLLADLRLWTVMFFFGLPGREFGLSDG